MRLKREDENCSIVDSTMNPTGLYTCSHWARQFNRRICKLLFSCYTLWDACARSISSNLWGKQFCNEICRLMHEVIHCGQWPYGLQVREFLDMTSSCTLTWLIVVVTSSACIKNTISTAIASKIWRMIVYLIALPIFDNQFSFSLSRWGISSPEQRAISLIIGLVLKSRPTCHCQLFFARANLFLSPETIWMVTHQNEILLAAPVDFCIIDQPCRFH